MITPAKEGESFGEFAKRQVKEHGDQIKPYLRKIYGMVPKVETPKTEIPPEKPTIQEQIQSVVRDELSIDLAAPKEGDTFREFAKRTVREHGKEVKPYLRKMYEAGKREREIQKVADTPKEQVESIEEKLPSVSITSSSKRTGFSNSSLVLFLLICPLLFVGFVTFQYLKDDLHLNLYGVEIGYNLYAVKIFPTNEYNSEYNVKYKFKNTVYDYVAKTLKSLYGFKEFIIRGYDLEVAASNEKGNNITIEVWKNGRMIFKDEVSPKETVEYRD